MSAMANGNGSSGNGVAPLAAGNVTRTPSAMQKTVNSLDLAQQFNPYLDEEKLRAWMREKSDPKRKKHQVWHFVLTHEPTSGDLRCVTQDSVPKSPDVDRYQAIDELVAKIAYEAGTTAAASTGPQRFHVEGHLNADKEDAAWDQTTFLIAPSLSSLGQSGGLFDEPASGVGFPSIVGHYQRSLDTVLRLAFTASSEEHQRMLDQLRDAQVHTERLMDKNMDQAKQMQDLLDKRDERTLNVYKGKLEIERTEKLYAAGMQYLLPLLARWMGGALPPGLAPAGAEASAAAAAAGSEIKVTAVPGGGDMASMMMGFAKTLTPKQLITWMGDMTAEQQKMFSPLLTIILAGMPLEQKAELEQRYLAECERRAKAEAEAAGQGAT